MSAVLFTDVEESVITWLQQQLTRPVMDRVSKHTNDNLPFVIVERLGGPAISVAHEQATLTVEAWGKDYASAQDLCQLARQAVHDLPGNKVVGTRFLKVAEFAGPARLPDPVSALPRFVFTVAVTVRPAA